MTAAEVDPLSVPCPKCLAVVRARCLYLLPPQLDLSFVPEALTPRMQLALKRVGEPTKRPHNERYVEAKRRGFVNSSTALTPASEERRRIARLEADFDRVEYERLRAWLAAHAHILIGAGSA